MTAALPLATARQCPFYAHSMQLVPKTFQTAQWVIVANPRSNQCALITEAHSPCRMETEEDSWPDWRRCIRNPDNNGTGRQ